MPSNQGHGNTVQRTGELKLGAEQQPEGDLLHPDYQAMMRGRKDRNRARNRIAKKSRRRNRH